MLDACESAVALAPNHGGIRDSRGLARALAGNIAGAIEDFNAFITWAQPQRIYESEIAERKEWIVALEEGRNPFDEAMLRALR